MLANLLAGPLLLASLTMHPAETQEREKADAESPAEKRSEKTDSGTTKPKKVCRYETSSSSRIPRKICMTSAESEEYARDSQAQIEAMQRDRRTMEISGQ